MALNNLSKIDAMTFVKLFLLAFVAIIASGIINGAFEEGLILLVLIGPVTEELAKTAVIMIGRKNSPKMTTKIGLVVGLGFGVFEAILIDPLDFFHRLFTTIPLQTSTGGIDGFAVGSKRYWFIAVAIALHSLFNAVSSDGFPLPLPLGILLAYIPLFWIRYYLKTPRNQNVRNAPF